MAFSILQHNGIALTAGQNPTDLVLPNPTQPGKTIIVIVAPGTGGNTINSITDAAGNGFVQAIHSATFGDIWYARNTLAHAVNDVLTIHYAAVDAGGEAWAQEVDGLDTVAPLGPTAPGSGSGTTLTCTAVSLARAAFGIAAWVSGNGSNITATGAWLGNDLDPILSSDEAAFALFNAPGNAQATATMGSSGTWNGLSAYFYGPAPAGGRNVLLTRRPPGYPRFPPRVRSVDVSSVVTSGVLLGLGNAEATAVASAVGAGAALGASSAEAPARASPLGSGTVTGRLSAEATTHATVAGAGAVLGAAVGEAPARATPTGAGALAGASSAEAPARAIALGSGFLTAAAVGEAPARATPSALGFVLGRGFGEATGIAATLGAFTLSGASSAEATGLAAAAGAGALSGQTVGEAPAVASLAGQQFMFGAGVAESTGLASAVGLGFLTLRETSEATGFAMGLAVVKQAMGFGEATGIAQITGVGQLSGAGFGEEVSPRATLFVTTIAPQYGGVSGTGPGKIKQYDGWEPVDQSSLYDTLTKLMQRQAEIWQEQIRLSNLERLRIQSERDRHYKEQLDRAAALLAQATGQATKTHPVDELPAVAASLLAVLKMADGILKKFS